MSCKPTLLCVCSDASSPLPFFLFVPLFSLCKCHEDSRRRPLRVRLRPELRRAFFFSRLTFGLLLRREFHRLTFCVLINAAAQMELHRRRKQMYSEVRMKRQASCLRNMSTGRKNFLSVGSCARKKRKRSERGCRIAGPSRLTSNTLPTRHFWRVPLLRLTYTPPPKNKKKTSTWSVNTLAGPDASRAATLKSFNLAAWAAERCGGGAQTRQQQRAVRGGRGQGGGRGVSRWVVGMHLHHNYCTLYRDSLWALSHTHTHTRWK